MMLAAMFRVEIRPGVFRPDWSAVTTQAAREALCARFASRQSLIDKWSIPLEEGEDRLWRHGLRLFADLGKGPNIGELGAAIGWSCSHVADALLDMQHRDLLGLDAAASVILYAYPFSGHVTGHTVALDGRVLNAVCAVDALGVGAMCKRDITVTSRCRACDTEIQISTANQGQLLQNVFPTEVVIWYDLGFEDCAAKSCCQKIAFFCSDRHLQTWRDRAGAGEEGSRLAPVEALEVGRALFGPLLTEAMIV